MKVYEVGGSVRDALLGLQNQDHDYVVVGATPEELVALGYKPVGTDFPVFLHPDSRAEYALARTERKTAPGYQGFVFHTSPDVTLEEDLARRDFTVNAIARDADGTLVDPYGGVSDLNARLLRHVGAAFVEDPVRVLRGARFAARFAALGFNIAAETKKLMQAIAQSGELDHLVPERVWQELSRGLMEDTPSKMFGVLRDCGALARLLPEVDRLFGVPQSAKSHPEIDTGVHVMMALDYAASMHHALPIRFAALGHDLGKGVTPSARWPHHPGHEQKSVELVQNICDRLRLPGDCRDLARMTAQWHGDVHAALQLKPEKLLAVMDATDALRRPARFRDFIEACACDYHGRTGFADKPYLPREFLLAALTALQALDFGRIAQSNSNDIPNAMERAKLEQLQTFIIERNTA